VTAHPPIEDTRLHPLGKDLIYELVCERLTGESAQREFIPTAAMQRGIDQEDQARGSYEAETGNLVSTSIAFMERDDCLAGCSPDGVVEIDE
jgi:hypothetical protein